jgi:hypothetical protein
VAGIERPQRLRRQQAELVVVQHHLRLDRRVVRGHHRARALAGAQCRGRFGQRQQPADAVVRDAGVRPLQAVADADMAEHVVRQRAQQPQRVDRGRQLLAEGRQFALGRGDQRQVVVLVGKAAAARADEHAGRVGKVRGRGFVQGVAPGAEPGVFDRAVGCVQAEHVGAADVLEQLAVAGQLAGVVVGHLGGDGHRPAAGVPLRDRRQRRAAFEQGGEDGLGRLASAADPRRCR